MLNDNYIEKQDGMKIGKNVNTYWLNVLDYHQGEIVRETEIHS